MNSLHGATWKVWVPLVLALAAYGLLGWWWSGHGNVEEWIYRIGLTAATVMPLVYAAVYTARAKWWTNPIGTSLVLASLAMFPITFPLAYAFWFLHGILSPSWLAWLAVSGPCLSALAFTGMTIVWLRVARGKNKPPEEEK